MAKKGRRQPGPISRRRIQRDELRSWVSGAGGSRQGMGQVLVEFTLAAVGICLLAFLVARVANWLNDSLVERNENFQTTRVAAASGTPGLVGFAAPTDIHLIGPGPESAGGLPAQSQGESAVPPVCTADDNYIADAQLKRNEATALQNTLQSKRTQVGQLEEEVKRLIARANDLSQAAEDIDQLNADITAKETEISNKEIQISNKEIQIGNKEIQVSNKEIQVSNKEIQVSNKETEISNKQAEINATQAAIDALGSCTTEEWVCAPVECPAVEAAEEEGEDEVAAEPEPEPEDNWWEISVICTELHRQGYMPDAWLAADLAYGEAYVDEETIAAYHSWARPVVARMRRSSIVTQIVRPFGVAWAKHMAYVMGESEEDSQLGRLLHEVGLPLNRALGRYQSGSWRTGDVVSGTLPAAVGVALTGAVHSAFRIGNRRQP